ncbi:adenine nucleotide alpha hydrolases-like protein [Xylariaceae sp. FL0594]|nr:adenine nucleotide alpha hydrolases-like protein [Xylariaceae sp. FL0594]
MAGKQLMSLEAALEEERKEIESLMSMQQPLRRPPSAGPRSPSPYVSPRSPVRSMLDIGDSPPPPPRQPTRSMLDIDTPLPTPSSTHTSPTLATRAPVMGTATRNRSMSDAASQAVPDLGPRSAPFVTPRNTDLTSAYKFHDILPTNVGQALPPKRNAASAASRGGSLGEALRGADLSNLVLPGEPGRPLVFRKNKSKSPNNRFSLRSSSPFANSSTKRATQQNTYMLDNGEVFDMNNAYRRLSDANLIYGGSSLASLAVRKKRDDSEGYGRIAKDNLSPYGELLPDESEDDVANSSDEENQRGRKLTSRAESEDGESAPRSAAKSLLAAVEDERKQVVVQPQYRSLFDDPTITITSPTGERSKPKTKQVVQPTTSYDQEPLSGTQTPLDPELDADVSAIKAAQNLQLSLTPIISTPEVQRSIRIIYRGEFPKIQKEADEEHRRLRKYLCATDLSDESTHALEWAIGTVLRDGDTLIAMYCLDEEAAGDAGGSMADDPKAMREQAAALNTLGKVPNARTSQHSSSSSPFAFNRVANSPHLRAVDGSSATSSPAPGWRGKSKNEEERERAILDITERVSKLLRKTQLQVRVIVEVIHCKNPKHLITEVIDLVNPTLVILGSRGRSALKGTLLGSFSNYLVTKSSVPVMVARKRLRKKSKYQPPPMKQVNNLANPSARSLEMARID